MSTDSRDPQTAEAPPWAYDPDPDDGYDPAEEFLDFECGMMPGGQCSKAGSEECDWECPRNR